ncbi:MAG: methyltransferase, partial [Brevundimonas sp.]
MRPLVLGSFAAALLTAGVAVAQTPPTEFPAQLPHRQGLAMEMPVMGEDAQLQAAIASSTRPEADRARDSQRHPFETLTFWGLQP